MRSTKKVQNTRIAAQLDQIHGAVLDIVSAINRPQRDEVLIKEAGIPLDRALFPLLVSVERLGPIGIVELADRIGRDHTTVSRQVTRLEIFGLVERQDNAADRRMREAVVSRKGKAMTDRVDAARERIYRAVFATWDVFKNIFNQPRSHLPMQVGWDLPEKGSLTPRQKLLNELYRRTTRLDDEDVWGLVHGM